MSRPRARNYARLLAAVSTVAIAVFGNVLAARHFVRWDATSDRRWSLSPATVATLADLPEPVDIWVLLAPGDPSSTGTKELLTAYRAKAGDRLRVTYIDPDRDGVAYADLRRRFAMDDARTEAGLVVADAALVVATKTRHWFVGAEELVAIERGAEGVTARPREERAITSAIRNVLSGKKAVLCFTTGHGEPSLDTDGAGHDDPENAAQGASEGLGFLRELLVKDNYEVRAIALPPSPETKLAECTVVVVPGLHAPFEPSAANSLAAWATAGGRTLIALPPIPAFDPLSKNGLVPPGLDAVLAPFGIVAEETMVFEGDSDRVVPETGAIGFVAEPLLHPITKGLVGVKPGAFVPEILVHGARSFRTIAGRPGFVATPLLQSSPLSYGAFDLVGAATWNGPPGKKPGDRSGPLVVAYAGEDTNPSEHPARLLVLGSANGFSAESFRADPKGRGSAFLLGGAISWLAERPVVLDIPDRPPVAAGVRMREEEVANTFRTVVFYLPASILVLFAAVFFFRRSGDFSPPPARALEEPGPKGKEPEPKLQDRKRTKKREGKRS